MVFGLNSDISGVDPRFLANPELRLDQRYGFFDSREALIAFIRQKFGQLESLAIAQSPKYLSLLGDKGSDFLSLLGDKRLENSLPFGISGLDVIAAFPNLRRLAVSPYLGEDILVARGTDDE